MDDELKACPFCGGVTELEVDWELTYDRGYDIVGYYAVCRDCENRTQTYKDEDGAITAWNRRVDNDKLRKATDMLTKFYSKGCTLIYIQKPLAWALYQTWKYFDKVEKKKMKQEGGQ